ncbi:MAG: hypothetical protein Q8M95_09280 [Candidatus Methanoperedens sp.]|nr:hypothetical protein [Candidatus Methanoperedens sp.]
MENSDCRIGNKMKSKDALVVFERTKIRRTWHNEQWYFSMVDVIKLEEEGFELYDKIVQLKLKGYSDEAYEKKAREIAKEMNLHMRR